MHKIKAAWIGFNDKDKDVWWSNAEALAKLGYAAMDGGDMLIGETDAATDENIARFFALGLKVLTVSVDYNNMSDEAITKIIDHAHRMKADRATIWWSNLNNRVYDSELSYENLMRELEGHEATAQRLLKEGIRLTYHNHSHEFTQEYKGVRGFDYMLINTESLWFDLDIAWVHHGGMCPVDVMRRVGSRLACLHVKDYLPPCTTWTALGTGVVDIGAALKQATEMELPYAAVEQDQLRNLDNMDTLRLGYYFMKESGFVE